MNEPLRENAKYWRAPEYGDMELLDATFIRHRFPLHFHEEYAICVIERGHYEFYFEGSHERVSAGSLVLINPGEVHSGYSLDEQGWSYRAFYPGITLMRQIAYEITGEDWHTPTFAYPGVIDPELSRQLGTLHRAIEQCRTRLTKDILLREAMGLLIQKHARNKPENLQHKSDNRAVAIAQDYIQSYYAEDVSLDDIANEAGFSPYYLSRMFKSEVGLPPHKYLIQVRIQRAKALLSSGMPIANVAVEVGFADQSHLTKWFKRVVGVPPGQFSGL